MARAYDIAAKVHRAYAWAGDIQIHYRRSGPPGARSPLLALHPSSGASLDSFMFGMGADWTVIAPDLPGTGMSDSLRAGNDAATIAEAMFELIAALGLGVIDVLAIAEAGDVAVEMARQQTGVVRKIVLIGAASPSGLLSQPILSLESGALAPEAVRDFLDR